MRSENLLTFLNRRVCVYLGAHGGMRPGEWFGLQWEDLDFANNEIRVAHAFNQFDGLKGPKSEAGKRAIGTDPRTSMLRYRIWRYIGRSTTS